MPKPKGAAIPQLTVLVGPPDAIKNVVRSLKILQKRVGALKKKSAESALGLELEKVNFDLGLVAAALQALPTVTTGKLLPPTPIPQPLIGDKCWSAKRGVGRPRLIGRVC